MGAWTGTRHKHDYHTCEDKFCERFPCRVYRDGWQDGFEAGHGAGYGSGYAAGFNVGYAQGGADAAGGTGAA